MHLSDTEEGARPLRSSSQRNGLASFPSAAGRNPYQRLLYEQLRAFGLRHVEGAQFDIGWLRSRQRDVRFLHFHWPQPFWRHEEGAARLRPLLSWAKLCVFAARLIAARLLGYRIVWTIHQVYPHEVASPRLDRLGAVALARMSHVLVAHDRATAELAREELGLTPQRVSVIPHGSYIGVYETGRPRNAVRASLDIPDDACVFLCLGELRAYKEVDRLLEAFASGALPNARLLIAGVSGDDRQQEAVVSAAGSDPRIIPLLGFVPDEDVAELFGASDVAVLARGDGGTSGSLILALSMGVPVVAARTPAYHDLLGGGAAGWLFDPSSAESLRTALETAAHAGEEARRLKGAAALAQAQRLQWPEIAARTAALLVDDPS